MKSGRKNLNFILFSILTMFILLSAFSYTSAQQDEAMKFFNGKTLNIIVPYTPGGGFDTYARLLSPYLQKYIPGLTVVVKNVPGAGSLIGTNEVYLAKPDGLTIGIVNVPGMVFNQVGGSQGVKFDLEKFSWLGRVTSESHVMVVGSQGDIKSIDDLKNISRTVKIGLTGVGSDDYFGVIVLFDALGVSLKTIPGYGGQSEATLAVLRGEVDGTQGTYSSLRPSIDAGDLIPLMQFAIGGDAIEGIPRASEVLGTGEGSGLVTAITNVFTLDRSFSATPGVPEDRLQVLRDAMYKSLTDPEFLARCKKAKRPVSALNGEKVQELMSETMAEAEPLTSILKDVFTQ